jgi:hypothetical protein
MAWLAGRALAMSPAEVALRVARAARTRAGELSGHERRVLADAPARALGRMDGAGVLRALEEGRGDLLPGARDAEALRSRLDRLGVGGDECVRAANEVLRGIVPVFGWTSWETGWPPDWLRDPVTGGRWPLTRWSELDYRAHAELADPRCVWEVNRCHFLVTLGRAYAMTRDERYARAVWDGISSWSEANPPYAGINWTSALEVAVRLISWAMALDLVGGAGCDAKRAREAATSVWLQARHVSDNLSLYASSRNNHLIGEAAGLRVAGAKFPWLTGAASWQGLGGRLLEHEVAAQIAPDGVPREQALHYGVFVLEFCLASAAAGGVARGTVERAGALSAFVSAVSGSGGTLPAIGDGDGGRAYELSDRPERQAQGAAACGALLAGLPAQGVVDPADTAPAAWLFGPDAVTRWLDAGRPGTGRATSRAFVEGGYFVTAGERGRCVIDCGPLGYRSIAAHGHADCLSIAVCLDDEWVVADPGTYCYHRERAWRDHFRSTVAHSTVTVDGGSQSRMLGPFLWGRRARAQAVRWAEHPDFDLFEGTHDGYARLGVVHRRRVLFARDGCWIVIDDLEGSGRHGLEATLQLGRASVVARDCAEGRAEHEVTGAGGQRLVVTSWLPEGVRARVVEGVESPPRGWVSSGFGEKHPAPALSFEGTVPLPARIAFAIAPMPQDGPRARVTRVASRGDGLAFEMETGGVRSLWFFGAVSLPDRRTEFAGALGRRTEAGAEGRPCGVDVTAWTESDRAVDFTPVRNLLGGGTSGKEFTRR